MLFSKLIDIGPGSLISNPEDFEITHLMFDSRKLSRQTGSVFCAIKTRENDGHNYIPELYEKGVRGFIITESIESSDYPEANFYKCDSAIQMMQLIARHQRDLCQCDVIGITGSYAKTIVKEWLVQFFENEMRLAYTPNSYNSQIGVAVSVFQMNPNLHELGIFEAGISQTGEMEQLKEMIQPRFGIFTGLGSAHDEGFESRNEKLSEKLKLFGSSEWFIYNSDQNEVQKYISASDLKGVSWGKTGDYKVSFEKSLGHTTLTVTSESDQTVFTLPFHDQASVQNLTSIIVFLLHQGQTQEAIQLKISRFVPLKTRLEIRQGINNCILIDDSYSLDFEGLDIALDLLDQSKKSLTPVCILSEMAFPESDGSQATDQIIQRLTERNIEHLIAVGDSFHEKQNGIIVSQFSTTSDLLSHLDELNLQNKAILIKGARKYRFEEVVTRLADKVHETRLDINLRSVVNNLKKYKSFLSSDTKIMVMVKALAYGSGSEEVARKLETEGVDYLAVAYVDEAIDLRKAGVSSDIMVMNQLTNSEIIKAIEYDLELECFSLQQLERIISCVGAEQAKIHLKFDTGMHRLGFAQDQIDQVLGLLKNTKIEVRSVFTHLTSTDDPADDSFTINQLTSFNSICEKLEQGLGYLPVRHALNSAGIVRFADQRMDMVRLGLGIYGIDVSGTIDLETVSELTAPVAQVRTISKGETIGYNRRGKAESEIKVATINIGYADGYDRRFSNGVGMMYFKGQYFPVIGNVCMDMTMIDVTGVEIEEGDRVEIFGKNLTVERLAALIGTIPYEILTNVSGRVSRVFYED